MFSIDVVILACLMIVGGFSLAGCSMYTSFHRDGDGAIGYAIMAIGYAIMAIVFFVATLGVVFGFLHTFAGK